MKAMIFAAGLGTRLKPLTDTTPKALVPFQNKPLLQHTIEMLTNYGIKEIVVNVHHHPDKIIAFLNQFNHSDITITVSDERELLLETGGGLKKASKFLKGSDPIIIINADVISNIDLNDLKSYHLSKGNLATLAVRNRESGRYLLMNNENILCGWENKQTTEQIITKKAHQLTRAAFSGIQIINPELLDLITEEGKFSIIKLYLRLSKDYPIGLYDHTDSYWFDLGKPEAFEEAEAYFNKRD